MKNIPVYKYKSYLGIFLTFIHLTLTFYPLTFKISTGGYQDVKQTKTKLLNVI